MEIAITAALILLAAWKAKQLPALGTRGIVIIALMAALASAGRMALAAVPSVQPASFIVMMCAMALGGGAGLYCGIITAVLSSLLTSFGPWTIWQAALWGLMGLLSATMKNKPFWILGLYGLLWGFVFRLGHEPVVLLDGAGSFYTGGLPGRLRRQFSFRSGARRNQRGAAGPVFPPLAAVSV